MKFKPEDQDAVEALVKEAMSKPIPNDVEARLRGQLSAFRSQMGAPHYTRRSMRQTALRFAWSATVFVVAVAGAIYFIASNAAPTWAEVMESFATVSFLQATIYVREDALAPATELELWMGYGGKIRLRAGNKVVFGDNGRFVAEIPISEKQAVSPGLAMAEDTVQYLMSRMGRTESFSFEILLRLLPDLGELSAPLRIQESTISKDLIVFDLTSQESPEWVRVWTLRESRLPVRVLYWDPRGAQTTDVVLSYGNQQSPEFFDPEVFKARMEQCKTPADRAYALIEDVGGRPMTPLDAAVHHETHGLPPASEQNVNPVSTPES